MYKEMYDRWLAADLADADLKPELESVKDDDAAIQDRFAVALKFGTAGLRGTMKAGLHQMNVHVIRWATQGFADVIAAEGEEGKHRGVAICMDCRNHSMEFARAAAEVCAANGIHVRIFESLRPTPELSFAVREYGCQAGINVTASHNPKEYNGYKVYWSDGAQLPPHHADAIAKRLEEIDIFDGVKRMDFEEAVKSGLIETMGDETDRKFMANVTAMINDRETVAKVADTFKLVYTPFHGCGYKLVPEALTALGIKHLIPVPEQMVIDGNFPTVVSPNPENPEGFYLAIDLAKKNDVDFILGTDPDSDRVGIMVRNKAGEFEPVTWDEAIGEIARRWKDIIAGYGGEAIMPCSYAGTMGYVQKNAYYPLFNALGASEAERTLCTPAQGCGWRSVMGATITTPPQEMQKSSLIILWSLNPLSTNFHLTHDLRIARQRGARIVLIDCYRTSSARIADEVILTRPGTDGALALAARIARTIQMLILCHPPSKLFFAM